MFEIWWKRLQTCTERGLCPSDKLRWCQEVSDVQSKISVSLRILLYTPSDMVQLTVIYRAAPLSENMEYLPVK